MKTYLITIIYGGGIATIKYTDDKPLSQFEAEVLNEYGTFTTLSSKEDLTLKPNNHEAIN